MSLEFEAGGQTYRAGILDVKRQFHVTRRLSPLLVGLLESGIMDRVKAQKKEGMKPEDLFALLAEVDLGPLLKSVTTGLSTLPEEDVDYVLNACMRVVERKQITGGWAPLMRGDLLMFEDLDMQVMLQIVWQVLEHSLSGFFGGLPQGSPGESRT